MTANLLAFMMAFVKYQSKHNPDALHEIRQEMDEILTWPSFQPYAVVDGAIRVAIEYIDKAIEEGK